MTALNLSPADPDPEITATLRGAGAAKLALLARATGRRPGDLMTELVEEALDTELRETRRAGRAAERVERLTGWAERLMKAVRAA